MDNHHCSISSSYVSCGLDEVSSIKDDVASVLYRMAGHQYHPSRGRPAAFYSWSGLASEGNCKLLTDFIVKLFGTEGLVISDVAENPKTGNHICVWVWCIPHEKFRAWYVQQRVERAKKL